jgi:hypothetical protein
MKQTIEYINTKGIYPVERDDYRYLVAWVDGERVKLGFSEFKDFTEGCAIVSYDYDRFIKDPVGTMSAFLDAHNDLGYQLGQAIDKIRNKKV